MENCFRIRAPLSVEVARSLACGQRVCLSGTILIARDAAHRRMTEELSRGKAFPFDPAGAVLFYAGPAPTSPGHVIGPIGPTTSGRMDPYTPMLLRLGIRGMIGKGKRSPEVIAAMRETGAVYFGATGGAAALLARSVKAVVTLAYEDLGPDAICLLEVEDMPLVVAIDSAGNDLYEQGRAKYINGTDHAAKEL